MAMNLRFVDIQCIDDGSPVCASERNAVAGVHVTITASSDVNTTSMRTVHHMIAPAVWWRDVVDDVCGD